MSRGIPAAKWLDKLEATRPFTDTEAWNLFRLAAFGEAIGWALLSSGLLVRHYRLPGYKIAVPITGQIHGTFFLIYFGTLLAVYSSLRWSRRRFVLAAMAGVPPFGTLVFEQWAAHHRHRQHRRVLLCNLALTLNSD